MVLLPKEKYYNPIAEHLVVENMIFNKLYLFIFTEDSNIFILKFSLKYIYKKLK